MASCILSGNPEKQLFHIFFTASKYLLWEDIPVAVTSLCIEVWMSFVNIIHCESHIADFLEFVVFF